jgi:60 kDa SS-A/Ro ribonucleoprotein
MSNTTVIYHDVVARTIGGSTAKLNAAGGAASFPVTDAVRARRFLILGCEGGSYYTGEVSLALENAEAIARLLRQEGEGVQLVDEIVKVSVGGLAAKQGPTVFALAMCAKLGDVETRRAVYRALCSVCRIPTHLMMFIGMVERIGGDAGTGWGKLQRKAVGTFYNGRSPQALANMVTKYKHREGWTHLDVLRLAHVKPEGVGTSAVLRYVIKGWLGAGAELVAMAKGNAAAEKSVRFLAAVEEVKTAEVSRVLELIAEHELAREHVPSAHLGNSTVWAVLLTTMPMTVMIRNLAKMTAVGLLAPLSAAVAVVCQRLVDPALLLAARVHPFQMLLACQQYGQGKGDKGSLAWTPVPAVLAALDAGFYASFAAVVPSGKRHVLALDVSGSMSWGGVNGAKCLTPAVASAAMAMVVMRTEPLTHTLAFTDRLSPLSIHAGMSLSEVVTATSSLSFGATDCAQPMLLAAEQGVSADVFVIFTDCETWAGDVTPVEALRRYREVSGIPAKLIVVAMTSGGFTLADPADAGMMDVVGFDASAPLLMREFAAGGL